MASAVDVLNNINGVVQLATIVEGAVLPIVVGTIKEVKAFLTESGTIEYSVVLETGHQNVQDTLAATTEGLTIINEERAKAGLPPLVIPTVDQK